MKEPIIGIDLGTRYAQIAIHEPGSGVKIIPNRWGTLRTPSFVALTPDGMIAGEDAARMALSSSHNVWWDMKRHLGTDWVARYGGKAYTPEDLLFSLLSLMREDAEAFLKTFVSSCVLAVPAHFSFPERGALAKTAQLAGFERVKIVNEPTAAALSVGIDGRFLVLDFGAGTLDISVVEGERGVFQVLESQGRSDIGGFDLDKRLCDWLWKKIGDSTLPVEEKKNSLMLSEAEAIKIGLSDAMRVSWTVPAGLSPDSKKVVDIRREDFELLITPLLEEVLRMVERLWKRYEPSRLLLVGGSSRIPLLRQMLSRRVYEPERLRMCPEEAVVVGTALYSSQGRERLLIDVLSRSLGVMDAEGGVVPLLERGTPLPAEASKRFTARGFGSLEVTLVQGEGRVRNINRVLQTIKVERVADGEEVEIVFRVDGGGLFHVEINREIQSCRKVITLDSDEIGDTPCDLLSELRLREERFFHLVTVLSPSIQQRVHALLMRLRSLRDEDASIQWQAIELLDRTIADIEQVVQS